LIIHTHDQGTPEWLQARLGIPTASQFGNLVTSQCKPSASQGAYLNKLVTEWLHDRPIEIPTTYWMQRGTELEPEARGYYEIYTGKSVTETGFVTNDDRTCGGSPDGLVGDDSGVEFKCPKDETHTEYCLAKKCPAKYVPQVQGLMYLFERDHWDFMSYYPYPDEATRRPQLLVRVDRDEKWVSAFEIELDKFTEKLAKAKQKLGA